MWSNKHTAVAAVAGIALIAAATGSGFVIGQRAGARVTEVRVVEEIAQATAEARDLEQRIMELVVARNPQATIRDFADFPAALLRESQAAGIDFRLVLAIIDKESEFNPRAVGKAGEIGLMQLMPRTAQLIVSAYKWEGYEPPGARRADGTYVSLGSLAEPEWNIRIGIAYLKDQVRKFGVSPAAIRAYNRGPAAAKEHRPADRYAEDVAFRLVRVSHDLREEGL